MKPPKSEAKAGPKVGTIGGTVRPLLATIKQALVTMPGINRLIPGGRKPVTHLYPYQKVELPVAFRGQHSIDWFKCIGCELCAKVCPNECIYFEFYEVEPTSEYLHPSRAQLDEMKKIIRRPAVDVGHCLFCGNCMEYCPTDAWNFTQEFELADYAREDLYYRADELRMPKENSDKEIVLINRIGEHPILEVDVCIGCRKCERECPTRCIDMLDGPNDRKGKPIVIPEFDYTKCIGCQQCVDVCPVDCLHMEEIGYKDLEGFYHINLQGEVKLLEEQVVKAVLKEQNDAGIDVVTDGQISWYDSQSHIARRLASVEINGLARYFDTNTYYRQPVVRGPVAWKEPILADEWKFARANSKAAVKAVLTGPLTLASLALDEHYRNKKRLTLDLANALGEEASDLVRAGAAHIQGDEPILTRNPDDLPLAVAGLERIRARQSSGAS